MSSCKSSRTRDRRFVIALSSIYGSESAERLRPGVVGIPIHGFSCNGYRLAQISLRFHICSFQSREASDEREDESAVLSSNPMEAMQRSALWRADTILHRVYGA